MQFLPTIRHFAGADNSSAYACLMTGPAEPAYAPASSAVRYRLVMLIRLAKVAMLAAVAALVSLAALGNITDYNTNFAFVEHVMSMDTLFPTTMITDRAVTSPALHHDAYALIIAAEIATALMCWIGALVLLARCRGSAHAFNHGKTSAVAGLTLGFLLYQFVFMAIAGEWFGMWMSREWNGVDSAFRYATIIMLVLLFIAMPDHDIEE
jgi:predicted small integral membrane protein